MTRRAALVAFAVVFSVLVPLAPVTQAAPVAGQRDVAAISTTDSDFADATTLNKISIAGTGADAVLQNASDAVLNDSHEDQDVAEYTFTGNSSSRARAVDNNSYSGSWSMMLDGAGSDNIDANRDPPGTFAPDAMQVAIKAVNPDANTNTNNDIKYVVYAGAPGTDTIVEVRWNDQGNFTVNGQDTGVDADYGNWHLIELRGMDFGSDEVDIVRVDGNQVLTNVAFKTSASSVDSTQLALGIKDSTDAFIDVNTFDGGTSSGGGQYVANGEQLDAIEEGFVNITDIPSGSVTVAWQGFDGNSWSNITTSTYTTTGNKTDSISGTFDEYRLRLDTSANADFEIADHGLLFTSSTPTVNNSSATPQGNTLVSSDPVTLSIDVNDSDFRYDQGDTVDVDFVVNGTVRKTKTIQSNQTVSADVSVQGGDAEWWVVANDSYGNSRESQHFMFTFPAELEIRNETNASQLITNANVTVQFFENDTVIQRFSGSSGTVDLSGLPTNKPFLVKAQAPDWHARTIRIEDITQQSTVYLLNKTTATSAEVLFTLTDRTGKFEGPTTNLTIRKPITQGGTTNYTTIVRDEFGAEGVTVDLETDVRYRLIVENTDGDKRVLGAYTPTSSETVVLEVGRVDLSPSGSADYAWGANQTDTDIRFNFSDPQDLTGDINLTIYELGNRSYVIHQTTYTGPHGNLSATIPLNKSEQNTTWVVAWNATRDGTAIGGQQVVGAKQRPLGVPLDPLWKSTLASGFILVVAGTAAVALPGGIAAILVSGVAMVAWYLDWLPDAVGAGVLIAGMAIGAFYIVQGGGR